MNSTSNLNFRSCINCSIILNFILIITRLFSAIMIIVSILFVAFVFSPAISLGVKTCDRRPTEISTPKSTNPHPFRIVFKGNVDYYVPEYTYTGK